MPVYSPAHCLPARLHIKSKAAHMKGNVAMLRGLHEVLCTLPGSTWPETLALARRQALFWLMLSN